MNKCSVRQLIFDPAGWVHPAYLPVASLPPCSALRSVVNQLILRQFALPATPDYQPSNGVNRWMVDHWRSLPAGALLLSALRNRATLSQQGALYRLPANLQQFARLQVVPAAPAERLCGDPLVWLERRMADEVLALRPLADTALAARLPLLFPWRTAECQQDKTQAFSTFCPLLVAVQYAERFV